MSSIRMGVICERAQTMVAKADGERRDLTQAEADEIERLCNEFEQLDAKPDDDGLYFARLKLRLASGR